MHWKINASRSTTSIARRNGKGKKRSFPDMNMEQWTSENDVFRSANGENDIHLCLNFSEHPAHLKARQAEFQVFVT